MKKFLTTLIVIFIFPIISSTFSIQGPSQAWALTVKRLSLEQLVALSSQIFVGEVVSSDYEYNDPESGHEVVLWTKFKVVDCIRGCEEEEFIYMKEANIAGLAKYTAGDTHLMFLPNASSLGFSSPTGIMQGRFKMVKERDRWTVPSLKQKKYLVKNLQSQAKTLSLSVSNLHSSNPDDYNEFKSVLKQMVGGDS